MDVTLHTMFRPIQINGTDDQSYYVERMPSPDLMAYIACYWESGFFRTVKRTYCLSIRVDYPLGYCQTVVRIFL